MDGVPMKFSRYPSTLSYDIKVRVHTHAFHTPFESDENSWGTMATLRTPKTSAAKETSLLTSGHFL